MSDAARVLVADFVAPSVVTISADVDGSGIVDCNPMTLTMLGVRDREELLLGEEELQRVWILRKLLHDMDDIAAIEFMVDKLKDTKTNDEFFSSMKGR